jgi:hypothetical protein
LLRRGFASCRRARLSEQILKVPENRRIAFRQLGRDLVARPEQILKGLAAGCLPRLAHSFAEPNQKSAD